MNSIAKMIDHSLLHPTLTDNELKAGCELAAKYRVACVCIKPYAVRDAAEWLEKADVAVGTVVGFPHGNSCINVKVMEAEQACKDGAEELDMVINIGKALSEDWDYVQREIEAIHNAAKANGALLKVIFENDFLTQDQYKIRLCEICSEISVEYVKTSTGYGFVKQKDGSYNYFGATDRDLQLMRKHSSSRVLLKAAGGIRTLDDVLRVQALGATRIGATATEAILLEAQRRGIE